MILTTLDYKRLLKLSGISLGIFLALLLLMNNIVMPLYTEQGRTTKVPTVVGLKVENAKEVLAQAGLTPREAETRIDKQYPIGTVAVQNPPGGSEVKFGRGVYLTISGGEPLVRVPSLRGKSLRDARFTLERTALNLGNIIYQQSQEFPENTIIDQAIAEGTEVKNGSKIDVTVSQGRDSNKFPVPNVTLKSLTEAQKIFAQIGFQVGTITYQASSDLLPNTVLDQSPKAGELLSLDQPINLVVAQQPEIKPATGN
jgi:eukaryotic-like serine/threonine-protein kinase